MVKQQKASDEQLVRAFYIAALFLIDKVEREGWYWRTNYLREHTGCTTGLRFANERSPTIYRKLGIRHPELKGWLKLRGLHRPDRNGPLFKQVEVIMAQARKAAERSLRGET
jgi:hypothetical protein